MHSSHGLNSQRVEFIRKSISSGIRYNELTFMLAFGGCLKDMMGNMSELCLFVLVQYITPENYFIECNSVT